jgi:hypothetical protein
MHLGEPVAIKTGDRIAQLILESIQHPIIEQTTVLAPTPHGSKGFGSTGTGTASLHLLQTHPEASISPATDACTADAIYEAMPYNTVFSTDPFNDTITFNVATSGTHFCFGMRIQDCPHFGLPQLLDCIPGLAIA